MISSTSPVPPVSIAPSILSANFAFLGEAVQQLQADGADWVHVDVMDGHFVPNLTIGPMVVESLRPLTTLPLDVHLMIEHPDRYLEAFAKAGADILTVHWEACPHLHRTLQHIKALGCKAGVSLNPATPVHVLESIISEVDLLLIMSVNPGFGGQSFIPHTLEKLQQARTLIGERPLHLQVDGGVGLRNCADIIKAGASCLVAGSAVFQADHPAHTIEQLRGGRPRPTLQETAQWMATPRQQSPRSPIPHPTQRNHNGQG